jgi:5-methylcytosine-specific restriction endonuclease McrA
MQEHTLLLSTAFEPLKVISWKRAITLVFLEKVEVLELYDRIIRSPSLQLALPAVVKLLTTVPRRPHRIKFSRQNLFYRDNFTCQYCQRPYPSHQLTYDHVIPRSRGGKTTWTNIVTSCIPCNLRKGNHLPHGSLRLTRKPEEPRWLPTMSLAIRVESAPVVWQDYLAWGQN